VEAKYVMPKSRLFVGSRLSSSLVALVALAGLLGSTVPVSGQSSAINGTIEGVVLDSSGGAVPGVAVTVLNTRIGLNRVVTTNDSGYYRVQLLPLGSYRVEAEIPGFRKFARDGVVLTAGMTARIDVTLELGAVAETVTVSGDSPVVDPAKIELGRVMDAREVSNIPLVSRNPFNFALLQANVTGYENEEFGVPRINANGTQMRTNFQVDGNTNTQKDRAGLRLAPISEIMVQEINLVTSGFAPEFGQTTGMVYNVVTPSGTNDLAGSASYRLRRKGFSSRPFFLAPERPKPDTHVDDVAGTVGGPLKTDKAHYYFGYEKVKRDLSADRVITVKPEDAARLGITQSLGDGVIPADADANFFIGKGDFQLNYANQLAVRYSLFDQVIADNIAGGFNTLDRSLDFDDRADSVAAQLVSSFGDEKLNELRVSWTKRSTVRVRSQYSATGPTINVNGVANFGAPEALDDFKQSIFQLIDSFTLYRGNHSFKVGASAEMISDYRAQPLFSQYTFATIDDYLAARDGMNPFAYQTFQQPVGDPTLSFDSAFYGFYFQDDWQVSPRFKVLYGVRYDLFDVANPVPFEPNPASSDFRIDKNNIAPRVGISWDVTGKGKTVLTAHSGMMYDTPLSAFYEDAILQNGAPRFQTFVLNPSSAGAPAFPDSLSPSTSGFATPSTIRTVSPEFSSGYSWQSTVQLRHALRDDLSIELAYVNARGRNLPVVLDVNLVNPVGELADGRPVWSTAVSPATRANPAFNHVWQVDSIAESRYNAGTFRIRKRFGGRLSLNSFYTLAKAEDDAIVGGRYVVAATATGDTDFPSDFTRIDRDKGATPFDVTHTWITSGVWSLATNTQVGFVLNFNSGLPFNIRSNKDVNGDGTSNNDRPVGVARNDRNLGWYKQVDARFSRFIPLTSEHLRLELFGEFTNLFNSENVRARNTTVAIDAAGNAVSPIPADSVFTPTQGYLARQFQLGVKLHF
jgi:Carboxypeptidase regulatory-like domain/TonB dependent receptor-like, beta-barrel